MQAKIRDFLVGNSAGQDLIPRNATSDQGLHKCPIKGTFRLETMQAKIRNFLVGNSAGQDLISRNATSDQGLHFYVRRKDTSL